MTADVAIASQGFGAGMSSVGAFYNAQGQKNTLKSQARIDDLNAKMADMSAQSALLAGQREEQAVRLNTAKLKSAQKTAFAANGIDLSEGSPVTVLTSTDVLGETDANTVAANAMRTAFGYQAQSVNYKNKALGERAEAGAISPWSSAAGTFLSSAGKVAESWYTLKKDGAFSDNRMGTYGPQNDFFARNFGQHNLVSDALY